jgi:crotonobetainyl-CoA:carnitine CoA-transferase CaiB-like acyl-CoA transferase
LRVEDQDSGDAPGLIIRIGSRHPPSSRAFGCTLGDAPVDFSHDDLALRRELQEIFRTRTQAEWVAMAAEEHLPIGPSLQGAQSLRDDPHLAGRTILVDDKHPAAGPFTYVGEPVLVDGGEYSVRRPAPELGEHTDEILRGLGYDAERIQRLRHTGVV